MIAQLTSILENRQAYNKVKARVQGRIIDIELMMCEDHFRYLKDTSTGSKKKI
jgi:hypothetical protein